MIGNIILETTYSVVEPGDGTVAHKHVLHREPNGCITYNRIQSDGSGWATTCFHDDLEKGIKFFLKAVSVDRRDCRDSKNIKILLPKTNAPGQEPLCKDWHEVMSYLNDAYDANIDALSSSQYHLVKLMQSGGSWAERVYAAIPDVIDPLLKRVIKKPE